MQRAVVDALAGGPIQRLGQAAQRHDDGFERRRAVLPERRVERVTVGVVLREVRGRRFDPCGQRRDDRGMLRLIGDQILECCRQLLALLGRGAKPEDLQRDETIPRRVVRAKNGTEAAGPNLMQDAKGTTGGRRRVESGSVSVQRWCSGDWGLSPVRPKGDSPRRRIVTRFVGLRPTGCRCLDSIFQPVRQYGFRAVAFRPFL